MRRSDWRSAAAGATLSSMKTLIRLLAAALALPVVIGTAAADMAPVKTESGLVAAAEEKGALVYKAIPYAAPPTGRLRWRAPEPASPWPGVRAAEQFAPKCMQKGAYPEDAPAEAVSEDCLYLNIWAPGDAAASKRPVMVWIHGGGLLDGSGAVPLYAGDALVRRGVIVVTLNYRLGAFGFLAHPDLSRESPHGVSGNYGLLDQLAALGWVRRNIAAFGGDPDNITVFGQSSGSISISALIASPLSKGLFHRAIGQSGGFLEPIEAAPDFALAGAEKNGAAFAAKLGAETLDALRALPAETILARRFAPGPVIDGYALIAPPYRTYRAQGGLDLLVGSNAEEGLYFATRRTITAANLASELRKDFPPIFVALLGPKKPADDAAARRAFVAFESRMRFGWNMWAWARLNAKAGGGRTYFYRFDHAPPGAEGAAHGAEMIYAFDHLDQTSLPWTDEDRRLAESMAFYWTNFAKTGDPNGPGLPQWPAFTAQERAA
ncbi:MAG: carboxylesterase family protein, partial [Parvularculaceae bacterium]|nr:carboxylesterase family protein [Parvularculaceae bacterium]